MDKPPEEKTTLTDFITGRCVPNTGAEGNRQEVERFLVEHKGYHREDIEVDAKIALNIEGECYQSTVDLVVRVNGFRCMVIKCAAGSLASRDREVISAARLLEDYQIPLSVASDGQTAFVWDTVSGKTIGKGLGTIPSKAQAQAKFDDQGLQALDEKHRQRLMLIYRTYATQSCSSDATA